MTITAPRLSNYSEITKQEILFNVLFQAEDWVPVKDLIDAAVKEGYRFAKRKHVQAIIGYMRKQGTVIDSRGIGDTLEYRFTGRIEDPKPRKPKTPTVATTPVSVLDNLVIKCHHLILGSPGKVSSNDVADTYDLSLEQACVLLNKVSRAYPDAIKLSIYAEEA
jgi:hypothetical protein